MNKVFLVGNLVRDPELRSTNDGTKVCYFTIACNRRKKPDGTQEADFPNIQAWRIVAENCAKYLSKGSKVAVAGELRTRSYDKDGHKVYVTEVLADSVEFLSRPAQHDEDGGGAPAPGVDQETGEVMGGATNDRFTPVNDDDLPF